ncbi:uroporphyrinogen-III synthase [Luteibaculum oceani]|uniref:Uroporphyrinogen-III synthase n=1 Tax=Luteibaculum oceani TaxID=1294296 RepID=A0A5C6VI45_9FLAO|nr:uroporphyrinogen-III synthase [Luteibaculum oceani]TXC85122.1 uroporphyrinogen-III synthase [Luteibaculum oceani]
MKIKSILISQPAPSNGKSPYFEIAEKHKVKIDFRSFIHVEGVEAREFRKEKINILDHTAVILTSRNAVDHFFRLCEEMRITVPDTMKYFCISESTAFYLQNYIVYRKRKVFVGNLRFEELMDSIKKHKNEKFLLPCSDIQKSEIPDLLNQANINFTKAVMYRTVASDLSDLKDIKYDMLVFFSPSGIESLFKNFPDFTQDNTKIAAFGPTTAKAVKDHGLRLDLNAPLPNAPSMSMAIEQFLKK